MSWDGHQMHLTKENNSCTFFLMFYGSSMDTEILYIIVAVAFLTSLMSSSITTSQRRQNIAKGNMIIWKSRNWTSCHNCCLMCVARPT